MKFIRQFLGQIIIFIDWITSPSRMKRSNEAQQKVDGELKKLSLYQFHACPFCVKVRRKMKKLNLQIELKDAMNNETDRAALLAGRGKVKVPCLRIESENGNIEWMPESSDINAYLESQFA